MKSNPTEVRQAMDILFGLLNHIDKGDDDVIFFADEGGSWQVGVDWAKVLPVWFKVLSATAEPEGMPNESRPCFLAITAMAATRCLPSLGEQQRRTNARPSQRSKARSARLCLACLASRLAC